MPGSAVIRSRSPSFCRLPVAVNLKFPIARCFRLISASFARYKQLPKSAHSALGRKSIQPETERPTPSGGGVIPASLRRDRSIADQQGMTATSIDSLTT